MDDQVVLDTFGFISLLAFCLFAWRRCWCSFGLEMEAFYDGNFTGRMSDVFLSFAIFYLHAQIGFAWRRTDTTCILNVLSLEMGGRALFLTVCGILYVCLDVIRDRGVVVCIQGQYHDYAIYE